jgi:hypothetical protein
MGRDEVMPGRDEFIARSSRVIATVARHACVFDRRQERTNPDHSLEGTPATLKGNGVRLSKGLDLDDPLADQRPQRAEADKRTPTSGSGFDPAAEVGWAKIL